MKFFLDVELDADSDAQQPIALRALPTLAPHVGDIGQLSGEIVVVIDGHKHCDGFVEPVVRSLNDWLRKLPWIIGGDTETVALRNSEHCFAFIPAGDSVEISFFVGTEAEIEDYIMEPITVRTEAFVTEALALGDKFISLVKSFDPKLIVDHEDCKDLNISLTEAHKAWHDHQLHSRR